MNCDNIEYNEVLKELLIFSSESESENLFPDDTDNDSDFTTDGLNALDLLQEALPPLFYRAIPEIKEYLVESFGNSTRIDYGTGHEMSFCMFLCCLFKIGAFVAADNLAVVCKVFNRYMVLVRRLQTVYKMEPAGSRGVWALDDFQFIPFIWGSSQLIALQRQSAQLIRMKTAHERMNQQVLLRNSSRPPVITTLLPVGNFARDLSHLRFSIAIWGGTTVTNLQRLLLIQKKVIRTLKGLRPKDSCREGFKDLHNLTVVIMFSDSNGFPRGTDVHQYQRCTEQMAGDQAVLHTKKISI
ncbi:Serine/threonine-protein phosphatase 2A activator [Homalodisca vitripennis]|nr:Serine/threonine-protein phosphatase 2A activator [Homalodisca vitripennis]